MTQDWQASYKWTLNSDERSRAANVQYEWDSKGYIVAIEVIEIGSSIDIQSASKWKGSILLLAWYGMYQIGFSLFRPQVLRNSYLEMYERGINYC